MTYMTLSSYVNDIHKKGARVREKESESEGGSVGGWLIKVLS